jgi:hypothetical protein
VASLLFRLYKSSFRELVDRIGWQVELPVGRSNVLLCDPISNVLEEVKADLLGKMLRYRQEERVTMREDVAHPWSTHGHESTSAPTQQLHVGIC